MVVCTLSQQIHSRDQMWDAFGPEFQIVDREWFRTLRRARGIHANLRTHFPRLICSIDFLKRDQLMRLMRYAVPGRNESAYPPSIQFADRG